MLQVPLPILKKRWTVLCIDLRALIADNTTYEYAAVKSIQLCASLRVRGVFTSTVLYSPEVLLYVHMSVSSRSY